MRGEHEREVHVIVDRDEASRYDLTLIDIVARIQAHNLNLPAGTFTGIRRARRRFARRGTTSRSRRSWTPSCARAPSGTYVHLRDVARVEESLEKRRFYGRYNGNPSLMIGLSKDNDADLIDVAAGVRSWVECPSRGRSRGYRAER